MNLLARRRENLPDTTSVRHSAVDELFHRFLRSWMQEENPFSMEQEFEISDKEVTLDLPCPGRKPENIDVEITGDLLTVKSCFCKSEPKEKESEKERSCIFSERCTSMCVASFQIPVKVIGKEAKACCRNGVLHIVIPRDLTKCDIPQPIKITCE